jgi:hypothetical protein
MNKEFAQQIVHQLSNPRVQLKHLNINNFTKDEYSNYLKTNKAFYYSIPTETFLMFQTDSILFHKNKHLLKYFLKYDYVGAPWVNREVGNGGLSLRKKSKMLEIIEKEPYNNQPEDVFFASNKTVTLYKPSFQEATHFAVEGVYQPFTFGSHQPWMQKHTNFYSLYPELVEFEKLHGK